MIFMRPLCLLLLIIPFVLHFIVKHKALDNTWKKYVSASLLKHLTVLKGKTRSHFLLVLWCWTLLTLALSGPCFDKIPTPQIQSLSSTVIILDLNTITPSQLPRVKAKLLDMTDQLKEDKIALVLYDEKGYTALPLTQDKDIIKEMIPILNQSVLPQTGNDTKAGFDQALNLLKNEETSMGRILFITGGAVVKDVIPLLKQENIPVGILGVEQNQNTGPEPLRLPDGSLLRDKTGQVLFAQLNQQELSQLGTFIKMSSTDRDIEELLNKTQPRQKPVFNQENSLFTMPSWRDMGVYLVLVALPFVALFFRKGVLFLWLLLIAPCVQADMWVRQDQLNYQTSQRGIEAYHKGDYQQALDYFMSLPQTPDTLYNQANALAHQQKIQEAINLYQQVLDKEPTHQNALFNKKYLEDQLKSSQQNQSQGQGQNQDEQNNQDNTQDQQDQNTSQNDDNQQENNQSGDNNNQQDSLNDTQSDDKGSDQLNDSQNQKSQSDEIPQSSENQQTGQESDSQSRQQNEPQSQPKNESQINQQPEKETNQQNSDSQQQKESLSQQETAQQKNESHSQTDSFLPTEETNQPIQDQQAQEIYHRLKKDPTRLLRYRLYEQNRRKNNVSY